jgi:hypothetical protein
VHASEAHGLRLSHLERGSPTVPLRFAFARKPSVRALLCFMALASRSSRFLRPRLPLPIIGLFMGMGAEPACTFPEYRIAATELSPSAAGAAVDSSVAGGPAAGSSAGGSGSGSSSGSGSCGAEPCWTCPTGRADCNQLIDDGCETSLETGDDCGACGVACTNGHGTNVCVSDAAGQTARCEPTCAAGFRDCDLRPNNGCETSLNSDVLNCGACGHGCPANGGTPVCVGGKCGVSSCNPGLGDCSNNGTCSFNLASDPFNCGQCGYVCASDHGEARCNAGVCVMDCEAGYGDCNRDSLANDGCETKLNQPDGDGHVANCGACGALCQRRAYTTIDLEQCAQGVCYRNCMEGAHDCSENRNDPVCVGKGCGCEFEPCP